MFEIKENKELLNQILKTNLLPLAFIGDSVHTLYIREHCLKTSLAKMENYHKESSFYCKASAQANVIKELANANILNDEEKEIVRRGRNAKPKHTAKNASSADYSYATAFEVLIGFLYLKGDGNRLDEILRYSIECLSLKSWKQTLCRI